MDQKRQAFVFLTSLAVAVAAPVAAQPIGMPPIEERIAMSEAARETAERLRVWHDEPLAGEDALLQVTGAASMNALRADHADGIWTVVERHGRFLVQTYLGIGPDGPEVLASAPLTLFVARGTSGMAATPGTVAANAEPQSTLVRQAGESALALAQSILASGNLACHSSERLVFLGDDGAAYLLDLAMEDATFRPGTHAQFAVDAEHKISDWQALSPHCDVVAWDADDPQVDRNVYTMTAPALPAPSALHFYMSAMLPMSMGVITSDVIWPMSGGFAADPLALDEMGTWD